MIRLMRFLCLYGILLCGAFSPDSQADYNSSIDENGCWDGLVPFEQGTGSCLKLHKTLWVGDRFYVDWKNICAHRIVAKLCVETISDQSVGFNCGMDGIMPGETNRWFSFGESTGKYFGIAVGATKPLKDWGCLRKLTSPVGELFDWHAKEEILASWTGAVGNTNDPGANNRTEGDKGPRDKNTPSPESAWVQFFSSGFSHTRQNDKGALGESVLVKVDLKHEIWSTPIRSTSIVGRPRLTCTKNKALRLSPGRHYYSIEGKGTKGFVLESGECKAIEIPFTMNQ